MKLRIQAHIAAAVAFFAPVALALAQVQPLNTPTPKVGTLFDFVVIVLGIIIKIGIPVVTVFLIYAGYLFLTAHGDTKKIALARWIFFWTFIGASILLGAVLLARAIKGTIDAIAG